MDNDYRKRIELELEELRVKIRKLANFKGSREFNELPAQPSNLLASQYFIMKSYEYCLASRLELED